jgi:hypothetical protein
VIGRHLRKKPHHQWPDQARDDGEQATRLGHLHQAEKEGHHTDQTQCECDRAGGRVDHRPGEFIHRRTAGTLPVALAKGSCQKGDDHDNEKDDIHKRNIIVVVAMRSGIM